MKVPSFSRLFGKAGSGRKARRPAQAAGRTPRRTRLTVDTLEDRTLLATLPAPQVLTQSLIASGGQNFMPAVAVDPLDPLRAVAVYSTRLNPAPQNPARVILGGSYTSNGGQTWLPFTLPSNLIDPTGPTQNPRVFDHATSASVGFDRNHSFYVTYAQHNADPPYTSAGAIVFLKYDMSGGVPVKVTLPGEAGFFGQGKVLYAWTNQDSGVRPSMVVDNTVASFTDPDTSQTQSNPSAGTIYVTFATSNTAPQNQAQGFNPNVIRLLASSDGGLSFGGSIYPGSSFFGSTTPFCGNFTNIRCGSPRLTVSQGTVDGRVQGGQVQLVWEDFSQNNVQQADNRITLINTAPLTRGVGVGFRPSQPTPIAIIDGVDPGGGGAHLPGVTVIPINVNITHPGFIRLSDIDVSLSLTHQNLGDLRIELVAPGGQIVTLVQNRTTAGGQQRPGNPAPGLSGNNIGWVNGQIVGTRFDRQAARRINDQSVQAPYDKYVQPEGDFLVDAPGGLDFFLNRAASELNGTWLIRITDFRNSPPTGQQPAQAVHDVEINITSGLEGLTTQSSIASYVLSALLPPYPQMTGASAPAGSTDPLVYPDVRFNPAPVLASDNTLGSFSPNQGRIYLAYADFIRRRNAANEDVNPPDNLDIVLSYSDNGGLSWSSPIKVNDDDGALDGFSGAMTEPTLIGTGPPIAGRPQFLPQLSVDQTNGTLVATWYDARGDAARARVATYITTSIDGGTTFSPQTYVNPSRQVIDAATGEVLSLEPFSDNLSSGHPTRETEYGFGYQALAVLGGIVYPVWSGNQNLGRDAQTASRLSITTAQVRIANGPRIISSTMGPVKSTTVDGVTFNNTFTDDGTRRADSFVVEFDRPVEPASFSPDAVSVIFRSPTMAASSPGVRLDVFSVLPLNAGLFGPALAPGATRFLIRFDPLKALTLGGTYTGTYSYAIRPIVRDRIRTPGVTTLPTGTTTYVAQPGQINLRVPPTGTGGSGIPAQDTTTSQIVISGVPANQQVLKVTVNLTINHTFDPDLIITLVHPDGTRIVLSNQNPFFIFPPSFANFTNTTFDDAATESILFGLPPYTGSFRPEQALNGLMGRGINGAWALEIRDIFAADIGTLVNWSITIDSGIVLPTAVKAGNSMDQDNDSTTGEDPSDTYAVPRPLNGVPFLPPYDSLTLPLIVPGPHIIETRVPGTVDSADNLMLNGTVSALDVVFDRDMNPASFGAAQVLRIMGPAGLISGPFTVTANPSGTDATLARRTFRIGFPTQQLSGTYVVTLGSGIQAANGELMDANQNAGLDVLRDVASPGTSNVPVTYNSSTQVPLTANKTSVAVIDVPENYVVQGATLQLNITHASVPNLSAVLVAPDGAEVRLFTKVGNSGTRANFTNTTFDDAAVAPIQNGTPPFFGSFTPQEPLARLRNRPAGGRWTLRITSDSPNVSGTLTSWSLTLLRAAPNSGLGEPIADQSTASFRIFTMANNNPQSKSQWTAVGPAPIVEEGIPELGIPTTSRTSRIGGLALDPSDPSGNTVYVAGASGGVWKTTNFLTTDPLGPTYIPLTDFGPSFGTNIGGIAVFGRNNDTRQTIIFAVTGEGDAGSPGVGFLRSMDGGATWTVLDSTRNIDNSGNPLPINSSQRDHIFVGTTSFKVVIDPKLGPDGEVIVYAAVADLQIPGQPANRAGGIWRSLNSGKTWERMRAGQASDVALAPQSASGITGNLQVVYAGFVTEGVFISSNQGSGWQLMGGTVGNPLIRDGDVSPPNTIPVTAATQNPNGQKGRITLAVPAATGDRAQDTIYAGYLYAMVTNLQGGLDGIYMTKDFGQNWTYVRIPGHRPRLPGSTTTGPPLYVVPTNDANEPDNNLLLSAGIQGQGSYDVSLIVDPLNPSIVYVGGAAGEDSAGDNRLIRLDTTFVFDPHAFIRGSNSANDGGQLLGASTGPINLRNPRTDPARLVPPLLLPDFNYYVNLIRDPDNIFLNDATILLSNTTQFNNQGTNGRWTAFTDVLEGSVDQHRVIAFRDPVSGKTRLVFGDDQGVFSGVDRGDGQLLRDIGGTPLPTGTRNGNLQITQFYYGAAQPSILAAEIAGSLFYGTNQDTGYPKSEPDILRTGNLAWRGPGGDGTGVATDQTGSGTAYAYLWPCCGGGGTNFFRVDLPPTPPENLGVGRTFGLLQQNQPGQTPDPQWPQTGGFNLAVNPISGQQAILGSAAGRLFRTQNQGLTWFEVGPPTELDGTPIIGLAYGAPNPTPPGQQGNLDDFIYAGTQGGRIFVTFTGGGGQPGSRWFNISAGLDGSPVQAIVTNPTRGSKEAYAVTVRGVYYMRDASATGATWINITGDLFNVTHDPFGDSSLRETRLKELTSLAADWRYALPNDGTPGAKHPVLYVGGEGGVYRSTTRGGTWRPFPDTTDGAAVAGGYLPNTRVTDLDLVLGNINPQTGQPDQSTGFNMLMASTYGRGVFAIRLPDVPGKTEFPGPRVVAVDPGTPVNPGFNTLQLAFSGPVDPDTMTPAAIRSFLGPNGSITVTAVTDLQDPITRQPPHTLYRLTFTGQVTDGVYTLVLGPNVTDFGGNAMNQNGNATNGEEPGDRYTVKFVINTSDNGRFITGLFNEVLLRKSDTEGFLQFIDVVDAARAQALGPVARTYVASAEARALLVADYYQTSSPTTIGNFLRRPAAPAEIANWVQFLQAGNTPSDLASIIVSSVEYFQNAGNTNLGFLTRLYTDLLARGLDAGGRDGFLAYLDGAAVAARQGIIEGITRSGEYFGRLVGSLYTRYLDRSASPTDISFWTSQLASGVTAERVAATLVGSAEYFGNNGGTNEGFVDAAYQDILGRPADAGGRAALLGQLAGGASRDAVALNLLVSDEYRGNLIRGYYTSYLGRSPSQTDLDAWVGALRAGQTDEQVISQIMASQEYFGRAGGTNPAFVDRAYLDLLGRTPDPAGRDAALLTLAQSQVGARQTVAVAITASAEYLTRVITTTYQTYLKRGPGSAEINIWQPLLASTPTRTPGAVSPQEQFVANVFASGEYFLKNGNTNRNWVASLYTNLLRRAGGTTEVDNTLNAVLNFYTSQRFGVAETFGTSTEARTRLILNAYQTYLKRTPLDQEVSNWLNLFAGGLREEEMVNVMVSSDEYFLRRASNNLTLWLDLAYIDLLGRARGANETDLLTPLLNGALTRAQVTNAIVTSVEYRRRVVNDYFRTYLGREGGLSEIDALVAHLNQGARQSQVLATVLSSNEYFLRGHPYP